MHPLPKVSFPLAAAAIIVLSGCSSESSTGPADVSALLVEAVTSKNISGIVGAAANPTPEVRIVDRKTHKPLAEVTVEFRLGQSGSVKTPTVTTDATGLASPGEWDFSILPGLNDLSVYVNHMFQLKFTATTKPDAPAVLHAVKQDQAALPGQSVSGPMVQALDRFGNAVPSVIVSFAVSAGGGSLQNTSDTTDIDGYASAGSWKLGATPGSNQATASAPGIDPTLFNAQVLDPATIKWYSFEGIGTGSQLFTPAQIGITYARIGFTRFDSCLCQRLGGYFLDEVQYATGGGEASSGRYVLDGPVLYLIDLQQSGGINGNTLILRRPDAEFEALVSWVYKEIDTK